MVNVFQTRIGYRQLGQQEVQYVQLCQLHTCPSDKPLTPHSSPTFTMNTLRHDLELLKRDKSLSHHFTEPPILALKQPSNLRGLLISFKLSTHRDKHGGITACQTERCRFCFHISTSTHGDIPILKVFH